MSSNHDHPHDAGPPGWFDKPGNVKLIVWALYGACAVALGAELVNLGLHYYHPHATFAFEKIPGINAVFGALFYCTIVFTAKALRTVVKRPEDYYD